MERPATFEETNEAMKYLLLIYNDQTRWTSLSPADQGALMQEYMAFGRSLRDSGNYLAGAALQPTWTARSVRSREGSTLATDGPFAETREQLGGFYLVEAADLDEAIAMAARIPAARTGSIEVRPILPTGSAT